MTLPAITKPQNSARRGGSLKLHREATSGEVSISPPPPQTRSQLTVFKPGTPLAVSTYLLGVGADSGAGRGGARNRADRVSHELTGAQARNLIEAALHADRIGLPLNRLVTVHWQSAGVPLEKLASATGHFLDLLSKMVIRHGHRTAWLWTHENGDNKGGHCHLLAHVPPHLVPKLASLQRGWLRRITSRPYRARVINSRPVGGRLGLETGNPLLYAVNLSAALAYCLKGVCSQAAPALGLSRLQSGGMIVGKRCGTSQNIGFKAYNEWKSSP